MKRLALLLFLLFMCIVMNAGRYSEEHRLYLRDGSVITCTTVEYADEGRGITSIKTAIAIAIGFAVEF